MSNETAQVEFTEEQLVQQGAVAEATKLVLGALAATDSQIAVMGMLNGVISIFMASNEGMTSADACTKLIEIAEQIREAELTAKVVTKADEEPPDSIPGNEPSSPTNS